MEKILNLEIIDFESVRMIGKKIEVTLGKNAKAQWQKFLKDGSNDFLQTLEQRVSPAFDTMGWMGNYHQETKTFIEMPGLFFKPDTKVPQGFDYIDIPSCKMAILWIEGQTPNLEKGAHQLLLKNLKKTSYTADYSFGFSMEYYTSMGYVLLNQQEPHYKFGYFLPVKENESLK